MPLDAILVKLEGAPTCVDDAEREDDFNAWYESEHLPGLAAVTGCVRARRLRVLHPVDDRAGYVACYDLVSDRALASDAWLAVRRTPWSDRVRPRIGETLSAPSPP